MTTSILLAPTTRSPPGLDGVLSIASDFLDSINSALPSSTTAQREGDGPLVRVLVRALGESLLLARTEEELAELTAGALSQPWLIVLLDRLGDASADRIAKFNTLASDDEARVFRAVEHPVARTMAHALVLMGELAKAMRSLGTHVYSESADGMLHETGDRVTHHHEGVAPLIADPATPPEVASILLAYFESIVAMLGLYELIRRDGTEEALNHPIAGMLARQWVSGIRQYLRLMASHPESHVPESVIPSEGRLDLRALHEAHHATRVRWHEAPEQSQLNIESLPELDDDA